MFLSMVPSNLVIRVNLYAQVLTGINKLDQQGKLITKPLIVGLTDQPSLLFPDQLVQPLSVAQCLTA